MDERDVDAAMSRINDAWRQGRVLDLAPLVDPGIVTVFPSFAGRVRGRDEFLSGFRDFCENATLEEFEEHGRSIDVIGTSAVASFCYDMVYRRSGARYRASGRDLWMFQKQDSAWIAIWRAMLDLKESALE